MIKRQLLSLLGFAVAAHSLVAQVATTDSGPPPMPHRPNIILIVADGLGYGDLGCYGQRNIKTPNLDHMASEGVRFTDFYAGSPNSGTARATLLTGRDAGHLKISDDALATLPADAPTVAEILRQAGYATGCLGEWDLGQSANTPPKRGFDEWAGLLTATDAQTDFPEFISRFDPPHAGVEGYNGPMQISQNEHGVKGLSINQLFTTAATNFAKFNKPDQFNKYHPFFLMLNYTLPRVHDLADAAPYDLEGWPKAEKFKAAAITRLDANIGVLLARLYELGQESNTIVFVTSDGGPRKNGGIDPKFHKSAGNLRGDGELLEGGIRVPLIVWGLGNLKSGEDNYQPAAAWDLFPTFIEIARWSPPEKIDGLSLLPPLQGKSQPRRHEFLFWETYPDRAQAVRFGDWKAIRTKPGKPLELYNLKADAAEKSNVAKDHPEIVAKIDAYLKTVRNELPQK